ncbi:hypothetical protein Ahy_B10g102539 [Arachis hypogaea]|uniref:Aminotransferase-like plant mobile domain-containing protein n=1 Tax=Arachis hypogaea TaxID=3818 RepID=A0A444X2C7_ARAHY|nr:hypothetical protein Ahy_B10g102539 [Arachis hypogaea]
MEDDPDRIYHLDRVTHITGSINEDDIFSELLDGTNEETVRQYARVYIMMLLLTQLFGDKSGTRLHIRWLPYVARLEDLGRYSWGWSGYQPTLGEKGPRVAYWRLRIDLMQSSIRWIGCYHSWGVQHRPRSALDIDFLMAKDRRRFLLSELFLGGPRAVSILAEVAQRGPGQAPPMDQVPDVPDRHRVEPHTYFGCSQFFDNLRVMLLEDDMERVRSHVTRSQPYITVDLNEPLTEPVYDPFALGKTPSSAVAADPPAPPTPDEDEDKVPLVQRA